MASITASPIAHCWQEQLRLSYLRAGHRGPAVVLLHGWGAFKELWWSTLLALEPSFRAFALDLPAHGSSPPVAHSITMHSLAHLVADFCAAQGLVSIILVGHSMGGNVALELALLRPDLVSRLVLVDPAVDAHLMPGYVRFHTHSVYGWALLRIRLALSKKLRPLGIRIPHLHGGGWIRPWLRRSYYMRNNDPEGMHRLLNGLYTNPLGQRAGQVCVSTLVITGQLDRLVPAAHSRRLASGIPGARFVEIPGAIHNPMDERPQAFERVLLDFLRAE